MKCKNILLFLCGMTSAFISSAATLSLEWVNADDYRDISYNEMGSKKGKKAVLNNLEKHLTKKVTQLLPADLHLELHFTEVDLAGEFEPFRRGGMDEVRIIKSIYPARLAFSYKLYRDEEILEEDEVHLTHKMFGKPLAYPGQDYIYTKDLLDRWIRGLQSGLEQAKAE